MEKELKSQEMRKRNILNEANILQLITLDFYSSFKFLHCAITNDILILNSNISNALFLLLILITVIQITVKIL